MYWLACDKPVPKSLLIVERQGPVFTVIKAEGCAAFQIWLDETMVASLDEPVRVIDGSSGALLFDGVPKRTIGAVMRSLAGRGDPEMMFEACIRIIIR